MTPLRQIADPWCQPVGMQRDPQRIGLGQQMGRHPVQQDRRTGVDLQNIPAAVDGQARERGCTR